MICTDIGEGKRKRGEKKLKDELKWIDKEELKKFQVTTNRQRHRYRTVDEKEIKNPMLLKNGELLIVSLISKWLQEKLK